MKIGILGCGNLGLTLGQLWQRAGHEVLFASSQASKGQPYAEVVESCPVLLYTLRGVPPQQLAQRWHGKTVIDCNLEELPAGFQFVPRARSLAQELAEQLPLCQVVKAFCLHPVELYHHGPERLREWGVQSFYCGDLPEARQQVRQLVEDLGMLAFDCGGLERSHLLEAQGNFWRLFQLHQGQALVSQFQLVGYPEPAGFERRPTYLSP